MTDLLSRTVPYSEEGKTYLSSAGYVSAWLPLSVIANQTQVDRPWSPFIVSAKADGRGLLFRRAEGLGKMHPDSSSIATVPQYLEHGVLNAGSADHMDQRMLTVLLARCHPARRLGRSAMLFLCETLKKWSRRRNECSGLLACYLL